MLGEGECSYFFTPVERAGGARSSVRPLRSGQLRFVFFLALSLVTWYFVFLPVKWDKDMCLKKLL